MVSSWKEYLVLERGGTKRFRLFTGHYECLAEIADYWNDETEDYDIPDQVNGVAVVGQEDDYLIGGELSPSETSESIEFDSLNESLLSDWASHQGWDIRKVAPSQFGEVSGVEILTAMEDSKPKHIFPDLSGRQILYNGRRYIAFAVSAAAPFDGYETDYNFVIWDGMYDAEVAVGMVMDDGTVTGELAFSHVEIEIPTSKSMSEFVRRTRKAQERFFRESGT